MDLNAYLTRIRCDGPLEPTVQALFALQRSHLFAVPFENLDIALGRPIRLEEDALFDKIITRRRGGFCYELNGLFSRLLRELGFQVTLLNARGVNDDGSYSREFDHLTLQVVCPDAPDISWLVDVGWGNGPLEPLRLDNWVRNTPGVPQERGGRIFQILPAEEDYLVLTELVQDGALEKGLAEDGPGAPGQRMVRHYAFTMRPRAYADFEDCCRYHSTSPDSFFARGRLCSLWLPDGRVTLSNMRLISTRRGVRTEWELSSEAEVLQVLKEQFEVEL